MVRGSVTPTPTGAGVGGSEPRIPNPEWTPPKGMAVKVNHGSETGRFVPIVRFGGVGVRASRCRVYGRRGVWI